MNFQNLNFDHVEPLQGPNPRYYIDRLPQTPTNPSQVTVVPISAAGGHRGGFASNASLQPATPSSRPTVIPYAPTPPSKSTSGAEVYGPNRLFGPPLVPDASRLESPIPSYAPVKRAPVLVEAPLSSRPRRLFENTAMQTIYTHALDPQHATFKDAIVREAEVVTPGIDDAPYIQYALDALTARDHHQRYSLYPPSSSDESNPFARHVPDQDLGYYQPPAERQRAVLNEPMPAQKRTSRGYHGRLPSLEADVPGLEPKFDQPEPQTPEKSPVDYGPLATLPVARVRYPAQIPEEFAPPPGWRLETPGSSLSSLVEHNTPKTNLAEKPVMPYEWEPRDVEIELHEKSDHRHDGYERLHFRPRLLRPASIGALISLCIIMIVLLIISAVFSITRQGLVPFQHLYGGLYFLFRVLPQLLACIILLYAQCTITVVYRILPFVHLHSDVREERYGAIFEDLYPRSFLWPCFTGPWQIRLAILAVWLANFTLPLQSAAFSVVLNNGVWKWTAVQGVVWTLVALYALLAVSLGVLMAYWLRRQDTGLLWDARSIADIIALVADTNVAADYHGTDKLGSRERIRWALRRRVYDRLGYWGWRDQRPGFWYTLGSSMIDNNYFPQEVSFDAEKASPYGRGMQQGDTPAASKMESMDEQAERDLEASVHAPSLRYRYLPWCLRSAQLLYFLITALVLFVALVVVSFLPPTSILLGFLPLVPAAPTRGSFSAANFLYSFLPSLLGLVMFLLFRALDQSVRVLQPWAALSDRKTGASTKASILADYAACLPLESTLRAAANRHWRLAIISALSTLFVLIPVLAGGIFMAATTDAGDVRMFPNLALFGLILALLLLYIFGLAIMLPARRAFRLPHGVTCLAEIISFIANEDLLTDPAFKRCRSRREMLGKLGAGRDPRDQPRWVFGISGGDRAQGGVANLSLGVRRMRRFTEKRMAQRMARRMGGSRRVGKRASDLQLRPAR